MSIMINGGRESSSQDFKFDEVITRRSSSSVMGRKPSNTDSEEGNRGGMHCIALLGLWGLLCIALLGLWGMHCIALLGLWGMHCIALLGLWGMHCIAQRSYG